MKAFIWKLNLCKCVLITWHLKGVILSAIFNFITITLFQREDGSLWPSTLNQFKNSYVVFVIVHSQEEISTVGSNGAVFGRPRDVYYHYTMLTFFYIFFCIKWNGNQNWNRSKSNKYQNHMVKLNPDSLIVSFFFFFWPQLLKAEPLSVLPHSRMLLGTGIKKKKTSLKVKSLYCKVFSWLEETLFL